MPLILKRLLLAGPLLIAALMPERSTAATLEFDFEITLLSEHVFVGTEWYPDPDHPLQATLPPGDVYIAYRDVGAWRDAGPLGLSDTVFSFGLEVGETAPASLFYSGLGPFTSHVVVGGQAYLSWLDAWVAEQDPAGDGAKVVFGSEQEMNTFDLIRGIGRHVTDDVGFSTFLDGSGFNYWYTEARFALARTSGDGAVPIAAAPLPAAPALLISALVGLICLRRLARPSKGA